MKYLILSLVAFAALAIISPGTAEANHWYSNPTSHWYNRDSNWYSNTNAHWYNRGSNWYSNTNGRWYNRSSHWYTAPRNYNSDYNYHSHFNKPRTGSWYRTW